MNQIIRVNNLTKTYKNFKRREGVKGALYNLFKREYKDVYAVSNISFTINQGEMVGYIGPNGAGKSTTIKMLTGILRPTSGEVNVSGVCPHKDRLRHTQNIGVVFGQRTQLWWDIAVIEAFSLLKKIYGISENDYTNRLKRFSVAMEIEGLLHTPVRKLSLGERMKCDLIASLLHNPPVVFLDEPTIGLDVAVKMTVRHLIKKINAEEKTTIILATHDLKDIEAICQRVIIIDQGRILYDGGVESIKKNIGRQRKLILYFNKLPTLAEMKTKTGEDHIQLSLKEQRLEITFDRTKKTAAALIGCVMSHFDVRDLEIREPELADIVKGIYEGKYAL
ncbi:MAG: ATP-binding cassette domain-containing protein [Deltaproteobacteria bacterium]|nr:ATP-binding cassette domain-containing protein [Deltaproteobacteria bacterium]